MCVLENAPLINFNWYTSVWMIEMVNICLIIMSTDNQVVGQAYNGFSSSILYAPWDCNFAMSYILCLILNVKKLIFFNKDIFIQA